MKRWVFHSILGFLIGLYLLIELIYVQRLPLAMDEFQFASEIERLRSEIPYRDFTPYKNLLGYYVQSLPLWGGRFLGLSAWDNLILLKSSIALGVAAMLFWTAHQLRPFFSERSILAATGLLVVMSTLLERSAVIRVEMTASLLGLAGAVFVLRGRPLQAGGLLGLAFLVTQKAGYFIAAAGLAFAFDVVRLRARDGSLRRSIEFGIATLVPVIVYFGAFSMLSSPAEVWQAMFVDSAQVSLGVDYEDKWLLFWKQTVSRNLVFYAATLLGLAALASASHGSEAERRAIRRFSVYAISLTGLLVWHRQPWPYFFVMLIPTAWIAIAAAFDAMARSKFASSPARQRVALALVLLTGMSLSAARIPKVLSRDNAYQRNNFEVLDAVVGPDETYLAGTNLLYHRPFQPAGVRWLDRIRIAQIEAQSPDERRSFLEALDAAPIKVVVRNYRTGDLPEEVRDFLDARFLQFFGSLSTHAPRCSIEEGRVHVEFPGVYWLRSSDDQPVALDGRFVPANALINLAPGSYETARGQRCQLQLIPSQLEALADPQFAKKRPFFKDVYTY